MEKTVCILAGARPNFVKVSPLVRAVSKNPEARCLLVYAGCEDDPTLEPSLFDDLQMPRPQYSTISRCPVRSTISVSAPPA